VTTTKNQPARFVREGRPDGFVVRLANLQEEYFPTATRIEEKADGSIDIWFDRLFLRRLAKTDYLSYWEVFKNRQGRK
jgi:hypothetical protein